jgi:hypothetical protein
MTAEPEALPRRAVVVTAAFVAVAAAILAVQVLIPPIVGVANNGDFEKVLGYAGLDYLSDKYEERYQTHVVREFRFRERGWYRSGYLTSETPLALGARQFAKWLLRAGRFDIRLLGAVHALLFLAGLGTIVQAAGALGTPGQLTGASLLLFLFTDVGYVQYFNSFYSQTASLLFFLLLIACAAVAIRRGILEGRLMVAFFLAAAAFVVSKPQEVVHAPWIALLALRLARVPLRTAWTRPAVYLAAGLCLTAVWYYKQTPRVLIWKTAIYQTVFSDLLPSSPDPAADLRALGLDAALSRYSGTHAFVKGVPIHEEWFEREFFSKIGYRKVLAFYAARPGRLLDRLDRTARRGGLNLRPDDMGNLERTDPAYRPIGLSDRWDTWSTFRRRFEPSATPLLAVFLLGNLLAAAIAWKRSPPPSRLVWEGVLFLVGLAVLEFLVCALADVSSPARHLFVFHAACDLLLVADAVWIVRAATLRRRTGRVAPVAA